MDILGEQANKLQELSRKQQFVLLSGPPRSGTTATLRSFAENFFRIGVNQPGMSWREPKGLDGFKNRIEAISNRVIGEAQKATGSVIIKEGSHLVTPDEMGFWRSICKARFLLHRTPPLQLESLIWLTLDRITVGGMGDSQVDGKILTADVDPITLTVDGYPLFEHGTDFTHLQIPVMGKTPWEIHVEHLRKARDYHSLGEGFKRLIIRLPAFEDPAFFSEVCHIYLEHLGRQDHNLLRQTLADNDVQSVEQLISRFYGIRWENFVSLPQVLIDGLFTWRLGYFPLLLHATREFEAFYTLDFTEYQLSPDEVQGKIRAVLMDNGVLISEKSESKELVQCPQGTDDTITRLDIDGWHRFYGYSDFRISFGNDGSIGKPQKSSMEMRRFPPMIQSEMKRAFLAYALVGLSPRKINLENLWDAMSDNKFIKIDPVTAYALAAREKIRTSSNFPHVNEAQKIARQILRFDDYYSLIDSSLADASTFLSGKDLHY